MLVTVYICWYAENLSRWQKYRSDMQKDTEKKYYKEGSVTRMEFKKLMQNYEERDFKLNEKEKKFNERFKIIK